MLNRSLRTPLSVLLTALVLSSLSFAVTPDRIAAIDSSNGVALQRSLHPQAQAKFDQGPVEPSLRLSHMMLMTTPSPAQQKALNKLLAEQQDRTSRNYHKWLTPAQFGEQFGLSQRDMNRITNWLKSQGFVIQSIAGARNLVRFSGTAAQVQSAFKSEIHRYNVDGKEHFANSTPLTIPAALNGIVTGIIGTHNFPMHPASTGDRFSGPKMRPSYFQANVGFQNFLSPADVAVMYDINGLYNMSPAIDGTGETIAIIGETDIFLEDINDFRSGFGLTQIGTGNCTTNTTTGVISACNDPLFQYVVIPGDSDPGQPNQIQDDLAEADIDIEWSGAIAPGAQIIYINAPVSGVFAALTFALNPPSGTAIPSPVVSMSYGECELFSTATSTGTESMFSQALSEGITFVNSSGDSGSAACDRNPPNATPPFSGAVNGQGVSYPASSPSVVAVGGTAISLANDSFPTQSSFWQTSNGANGLSITGPIPEIPWNDDEAFAQVCLTIQNPSQNGFCNPPSQNPPAPGVLISSPQTAQEDLWISAGGGGASNCFNGNNGICTGGLAQPPYQSGLSLLVTSTNQVPSPATRWVPDISFLASPNFPGYIICTQRSELGDSGSGSSCAPGGATGISNNLGLPAPAIFGGTSVSTPVFAGMLALLNQYLAGPSSPGLGDIHQMLYSLAAANSTTPNGVFNQVTTGDNFVYCTQGQPTGQPASVICPSSGSNPGRIGFTATDFDSKTGYNLVAGLGSVNAISLATAWNATRSSTTLSVSPSLSSIFQSQSVTLTATVTPASATGNVTFSTGSTVLGTVALQQVSGQAQAALATTQLPVGSPDTITATYNGSGTSGSSSNITSVTVAQAFSLNLTGLPNSYTVTPGQSAAAAVNLVFGSGFTGTVTFSCPSPGSEITCTAPTATNAAGQVSFTVQTTAPTASLQPLNRGSRTFYAALLPGLLGIMFTVGARKRSQRGIQLLGMILVMGVSIMWLSSCGGSKNSSTSNPGTPAGTYVINVSASSGSLTPATAQFQLVVQ